MFSFHNVFGILSYCTLVFWFQVASSFGGDAFAGQQYAQQQQQTPAAEPLKKPPRWMRRPCGANFAVSSLQHCFFWLSLSILPFDFHSQLEWTLDSVHLISGHFVFIISREQLLCITCWLTICHAYSFASRVKSSTSLTACQRTCSRDCL